ncbi:hypothetical protein [Streptomyces sp. NPDC012825]|uniref:hypothetical protein n=1 Tax=Streptomyces sp. NPDC012825 TaxID=3364851 RepID=UPI003695AE88
MPCGPHDVRGAGPVELGEQPLSPTGDESARYVPVTGSALHTMTYGAHLDLATGMLGTWTDAQDGWRPLGS